MTIKSKSYEECRENFFVNLIRHAENKIKYWKRQTGYRCEIDDNLSQAGAEKQYCQDALKALEKQIPKKPDYEGDGYDDNGEIIYDTSYCPCCRHEFEAYYDITDYCPNCGQALDWSEEERKENG